jgi:SAM-dependent methyltransferase
MHPSVMDWVREKVEQLDLAELPTLEVGSRNYNGSVRPLFFGRYVGIDMEPGRDVDSVQRADKLAFPTSSWDTIVTTEMLEHDPYFWLSMREMARVLKPGGYLLLTTRGLGFPLHEYPSDLWRFTEDAIRHLFDYAGLTAVEVVPDPYPDHPGVFGLAQK